MDKNNKGQLGLVLGLVGGVAFLIIGIIVAFAIVGTLQGSGIIPQSTYTITNESQGNGALGVIAYVNQTIYTLNGTLQNGDGSYTITSVVADWNQSNQSSYKTGIAATPTGYNVTVNVANYTIRQNGTIINATNYIFPNVSITYTYVGDNAQNLAAANLTSNFSSGVQNVSSKIPTLLLIAAIVLILGVMAILIAAWRKIRFGGSGQI